MLRRTPPSPKVVLITGASSGLGRSMGALLVQKGFQVFGTSRNPKGSTLDGFQMLPLDVTSDSLAAECIERVLERTGRLDVLVNNAGFGMFGALEEVSMDEARAQFETNFFGVVRMVNAALPTLRQQKSGQILNIASLAGLIALPYLGHYSATKYALIGYTEALRQEVWPFNIKVSVVEPGFFKTGIGEAQHPSARTLPDYAAARGRIYEMLSQQMDRGRDPAIVARLILKVINTRSPQLHFRVGADAIWLPRFRRLVPAARFEAGVRKQFRLD